MISNSRLYVVNSRNRESGTDTNFSYKFELDNAEYTHCCVMQASIPKSFYLVETGWNTFTLRDNDTLFSYTITITPGNYTVNTLITELQTILNTASSKTWTITSSTLTGKLTFTVSSGNYSFIFSTFCYEILGFNSNSTNTLITQTITSTNIIKLQAEDCLIIHSDICTNGYDNTLQEVFANGSPDYSAITYQCTSLEGCSKTFNTKDSNLFHFYITSESDNQIIDTNGINVNFSILVYKKNNFYDIIKNFFSWFVIKFSN